MVTARTTNGFWVTAEPMAMIWEPSLVDEIHQNVRTILSVLEGEVLGDRNFGVNSNIIDQPVNVAAQRLKADIVRKVEYYEPRVKVKLIKVTNAKVSELTEGTLALGVYVEIREDYLNDD